MKSGGRWKKMGTTGAGEATTPDNVGIEKRKGELDSIFAQFITICLP